MKKRKFKVGMVFSNMSEFMKELNFIKQKVRFYIHLVRRRFEIIRLKFMIKKEKNQIIKAMYAAQLVMIIQMPIPKYNYNGFIIPSSI